MNPPIKKGTFESESDLLALDIVDFSRLNGYWPNAGAAMRTIFNFLKDGNATYEVFNVPGFDDAPPRDDFPDWSHVGNHVDVARRFWNWFHHHFPQYELNLSDSPDFQCIKRGEDSTHFIWGDFGQVSASAFALCQKLCRAGDMWMSVLDRGHTHVLVTYWSDGADSISALLPKEPNKPA